MAGDRIEFKKGTVFPFLAHKKRINRYAENMQMFRGEYKDIFDKYNINTNGSLYVSLNMAGIICKKSTDMLLGEAVQVTSGTEDHSLEQSAIDEITKNNYMNIQNYESGLMSSIKGDSFYKVRWGQEWEGSLSQEIDPSRVIIEDIPAEYCYPETSHFNKKKITTIHVCIPIYADEKWYLTVESHSAGYVQYHMYEMKPSDVTLGTPTSWTIQNQVGDMQEEFTGINQPLVIHVPNYATDSWEGHDDLSEHKSLFDEINNRLSQIASILDKHADPAMAVPAGVLEVDNMGNPIFSVNREKVFEIMGKDDILPQYVTWNGQLQHAYSELDRLINNLLMAAEIPEVALGKSGSGTSGATGIAVRMRMSPLLAKVNRKRQYFDRALKQVYLVAQMLETVADPSKNYTPVVPVLKFSDGLPRDEMEDAQIAAIRTGSMPTMSQKSAIMFLDGKTEEQPQAEIDRINEGTPEQSEGDPDIFNSLTGLSNKNESSDEDEEEVVEETDEPDGS